MKNAFFYLVSCALAFGTGVLVANVYHYTKKLSESESTDADCIGDGVDAENQTNDDCDYPCDDSDIRYENYISED